MDLNSIGAHNSIVADNVQNSQMDRHSKLGFRIIEQAIEDLWELFDHQDSKLVYGSLPNTDSHEAELEALCDWFMDDTLHSSTETLASLCNLLGCESHPVRRRVITEANDRYGRRFVKLYLLERK